MNAKTTKKMTQKAIIDLINTYKANNKIYFNKNYMGYESFSFDEYDDKIMELCNEAEEAKRNKIYPIVATGVSSVINDFKLTNVYHYACTKCASQFNTNEKAYVDMVKNDGYVVYGPYVRKCPHCGNYEIAHVNYTKYVIGFRVSDDVLILIKYEAKNSLNGNGEQCVTRRLKEVYCYSKLFSPFYMDENKNTLAETNRMTKHLMGVQYMAKHNTIKELMLSSNIERYKKDVDFIEEVIQLQQKKIESRKNKKEEQSIYDLYVPTQEYDCKTLFKSDALYTMKKDSQTIVAFCANCHTFYEVNDISSFNEANTFVCPHCGTVHTNIISRGSSCYATMNIAQAFVYEQTNLPKKEILERTFLMTINMKEKSIQQQEVKRNFLGKTVHTVELAWNNEHVPVSEGNTYEELTNIFKNNDVLKYSGAVDYVKLANNSNNDIKRRSLSEYIRIWNSTPEIEFLVKMNLSNRIFNTVYNKQTSERKEILNVLLNEMTNAERKMIRAIPDCFYDTAMLIHKLYKTAPFNCEFFLDAYEKFNRDNAIHVMIDLKFLKEEYDISYKQAVDYLERVRNYQCIRFGDAMRLWIDYLEMATKLSYNLNDKNRKYPNSLHKDHDVASWAYESVKTEIQNARLEKNMEEAEKMYAYENNDFIIKVPHTVEDIVYEATYQHNCLRSYIEKIANGLTTVVFIRKKDSQDVPYATVEIKDGVIRQCYGKCNSRINNPQMNQFITEWTMKKNIKRGGF